MLVPRPPADGDRRPLADHIRLRARDPYPEPLTAGGADDENAVTVVHDDIDRHRELVRQRRLRARNGEPYALRPLQYVDGALADASARFHVGPHGAECI